MKVIALIHNFLYLYIVYIIYVHNSFTYFGWTEILCYKENFDRIMKQLSSSQSKS